MTVAAGFPEAITFVVSLGDVCLIIAVIGCVFMLVACACVLGFTGDAAPGSKAPSPVTVLKPLRDREPDLPDRLAAFCAQDYDAPVQILCGTQDRASPAAGSVREMRVDASDRTIELVIEPRRHEVNRKISNLINMVPRARHDTLVVSDSDIVVGPDYLRAVTALLALPRVGAVTCLYHGIGGAGLWTRLSALAINAQFLPQAITAVGLASRSPAAAPRSRCTGRRSTGSAVSARSPTCLPTIMPSGWRCAPRAMMWRLRRSSLGTVASRVACAR
jgi:ceramide glucosyltransferase